MWNAPWIRSMGRLWRGSTLYRLGRVVLVGGIEWAVSRYFRGRAAVVIDDAGERLPVEIVAYVSPMKVRTIRNDPKLAAFGGIRTQLYSLQRAAYRNGVWEIRA